MAGAIDEIYMFDEVLNDAEITYLAEANSLIVKDETSALSVSETCVDAYVSHGQLHITTPFDQHNEIRIYALSGALKLHRHFESHHYAESLDLVSGIYMLQIKSGDVFRNVKVVIK